MVADDRRVGNQDVNECWRSFGRLDERQSNGWTPERRERQAEQVRRFRPWERATGRRTPEGKARAAKNGYRAARALRR
jgi:hypothetical protein